MKLTAQGISAGATKVPVLQDVNLAVTSGKTLVILGPNGSGKSTLLKTLARQLPPLKGISAESFAQNVAYVPQNPDSEVHLSVEEYVSLGRSPHQKWWQWQQTEVDQSEVENALAATGLSSLRQRLVSQLSGGERQRAAIAIGLAQKPTFLLLDEPTAHLDFKHQSELLQLLRRLKVDQKLGMILVLHDLSAAAYLADEILLFKKGETGSCIAASGPAEEVLQDKILQDAFEVVFTSISDADGQHYFVKPG
jgi:iron complex transport system ATP-binding protein